MDYADYNPNNESFQFWFKGKKDLIFNLFSTIKRTQLKILNLGAGTGDDLEILNRFGEVYLIDIDKRALDLVPEGLCKEKKVCDACELRYPNNFFDVVVSFDVLEHIENDKIAIKEVRRVLKKRGYFIFSVPSFPSLYGSHDKALNHKRRYSKKQLRKLLSNFKIVKISYWNFFLFAPLAFIRILNKNSLPKVDSQRKFPLPKFFDNLLYTILKIENSLIKKNFFLPVGLSLVGIFRK